MDMESAMTTAQPAPVPYGGALPSPSASTVDPALASVPQREPRADSLDGPALPTAQGQGQRSLPPIFQQRPILPPLLPRPPAPSSLPALHRQAFDDAPQAAHQFQPRLQLSPQPQPPSRPPLMSMPPSSPPPTRESHSTTFRPSQGAPAFPPSATTPAPQYHLGHLEPAPVPALDTVAAPSAGTESSLPPPPARKAGTKRLTNVERMQAEFDLNPIPDLDALEAKLKLNRKTIRDFFSKRRRECGIEGRIETRKPTFGGGNNGGGRGRGRGRGAAKAGGGGAGRGSGKRLLADLDFDHDWTPGRPKRAKADTTPGVYTVDQVGDDDLLVEDDDGDSAFAEDSYAEHDASAYYGEYDGGDDIKPETATLPFHSPLVANHPVPAAVASAPLPSARPHDTHTYTNSTALPSQQTEALPSGAPLAEAPGPAQPEQTLAIAAAQAMPIEPEANDQAQKPRKYTYANSYFLPTDMLIAKFEENPFRSKDELEAMREGYTFTLRQVSDWFQRHRKNNGLSSTYGTRDGDGGRKRGRPPTRGRRGRGGGRGGGAGTLSREDSFTSQVSPRGGAGPAAKKKRRPGHGWGVGDDDENDYGSTTTEDEMDDDETMDYNEPAPQQEQDYTQHVILGGDSEEDEDDPAHGNMTFQSSGQKSRSASPATPMSWLLAAAETASTEQHAGGGTAKSAPALTSFTTHHTPGIRPLTYFGNNIRQDASSQRSTRDWEDAFGERHSFVELRYANGPW